MALGWILPIPPKARPSASFLLLVHLQHLEEVWGGQCGSWVVTGPRVGRFIYILSEIFEHWNPGSLVFLVKPWCRVSPAICTIYLKDLVDSKSQRDSGKTPHQQHIQRTKGNLMSWSWGICFCRVKPSTHWPVVRSEINRFGQHCCCPPWASWENLNPSSSYPSYNSKFMVDPCFSRASSWWFPLIHMKTH